MYRLDLLAKMKIYLVQYVVILKLAYGDIEPLLYKIDIYRGQEEDKQDIQKVISHKEVNK